LALKQTPATYGKIVVSGGMPIGIIFGKDG